MHVRRGRKIEIIAALVVIVALGTAAAAYPHLHHDADPYASTIAGTPDTSHAAADAYLVSKVGNTDFAELYRFDKGRGGYADNQDPKDKSYDFIAYHFAPFTAFDQADDVVMIQVNRNHPKEIFANAVPACAHDSSLCDFKVTKAKALDIASHKGVSGADIAVSWDVPPKQGQRLSIEVQSCSQHKKVLIDYRNGHAAVSYDECPSVEL